MAMEMFFLVLAGALIFVVGSALVLLRTAKKPRIPPTVKPDPYGDDDD
jgi:hypothetical protein